MVIQSSIVVRHQPSATATTIEGERRQARAAASIALLPPPMVEVFFSCGRNWEYNCVFYHCCSMYIYICTTTTAIESVVFSVSLVRARQLEKEM